MSVFVDPDDHERLVERARLEERSVSAELRVAIREHLGNPSGRQRRGLLASESATTDMREVTEVERPSTPGRSAWRISR